MTAPVVAGIVCGTLLVIALAAVAVVRRTRARRTAVSALRPGWDQWEVRAAAGMRRNLLAHGHWERGLDPFGGSPLTLAASPLGVGLWRGGRRARAVVELRWADVVAVVPASGAVWGRMVPAVEVRTTSGAHLVLVVPRGSRQQRAELLVAELRGLRDGPAPKA